eukprot:6595418-Karenia_brevis.AAC.1
MQLELIKLYAALRNDDAIWCTPASWVIDGALSSGFLHGSSYKTKATEATSVRMKEAMPWIAPARGVCQEPSQWLSRVREIWPLWA